MSEALSLKVVVYRGKQRPLKCNCADPLRWKKDLILEDDGNLVIHDTTEAGVDVGTKLEHQSHPCPNCGYYYWFTTGGKK